MRGYILRSFNLIESFVSERWENLLVLSFESWGDLVITKLREPLRDRVLAKDLGSFLKSVSERCLSGREKLH